MPPQPKPNATLWVVARPLLAPFWLEIAATEDGTVIAATFRTDPPPSRPQANAPAAIHQLSHWLDTWLEAPATPLWPRVAPHGTPFQQRVWNALRTIPCGETRTYGALAAHLSTSPRAVGALPDRDSLSPSCRQKRGADRVFRWSFRCLARPQSMATRARKRANVTRAKPVTLSPLTQQWIDAFIDHLWWEEGLSANTRASYRHDLTGFAQWLEQRNETFRTVTAATLLTYLAEKPSKAASQRRLIACWRKFFGWLVREGKMAHNPCLTLTQPPLPPRLPKTLTENEVENLLQAPDPETLLGLRDKAILELLYVSGPGRLRGTFMKSSGFSLYHLFMASMGGTCPRAFWGMW